jgi:hypothetical protein
MGLKEQETLETISQELSDLRKKVEEGHLKISESLAVIMEQLKHKTENFDRLEETLEHLEFLLHGRVDKPGLVTRLDRLEQKELSRSWHLGILWAAVVTLTMNAVAKFLGIFPWK